MKDYIVKDPWKIIENEFHPEFNMITESLCSLGNGMIGHRGSFEEGYGGQTLQGNYIAGIYYPDKTRVGWWKNGYPEYFAKVLNSANWIGCNIMFNGEKLDLHQCNIISFHRELDMKKGMLKRKVSFENTLGKFILNTERFCSTDQKDTGWIQLELISENFSGEIIIEPYVDFDVKNQDSNYDETFWDAHCSHIDHDYGHVFCKTKKTHFKVCVGMKNLVLHNDTVVPNSSFTKQEKFVSATYKIQVSPGDIVRLNKNAAIVSEYHHGNVRLTDKCKEILKSSYTVGYVSSKEKHIENWAQKWAISDIEIKGDVSAQQGIRFNIFHLHQTYNGEDDRLNIGPKGFTGEKYGGSTYWDTEAYCLPFYLSTADQKVAKNLLVYRYKHLAKAIENGKKLGFIDGAALYPMVTMNGEECHNEWEITFEEIHRNGAIAYAIYDYINYTTDERYLADYGLEVLIAIARFWAQRVNWSEAKKKYVILGVTGPNEYENNVNNNWYTNYIAVWCLQYCMTALEIVAQKYSSEWKRIVSSTNYDKSELERWKSVCDQMYFPYHESKQLYLQQDGFLDKNIQTADQLDQSDRPINQNWSWDRILRSCYIKQADVLQGFYFFENDFTEEQHKKHFEYYEPMTVHESSLSPCVHAILAAKLGMTDKAYEMYLRTSRLDIDDYNNDTEDGLHITSMAGTWMSITKGFGGMRVKNGVLSFTPSCPKEWDSFGFKITIRGSILAIFISHNHIQIENIQGDQIKVVVNGDSLTIEKGEKTIYQLQSNSIA